MYDNSILPQVEWPKRVIRHDIVLLKWHVQFVADLEAGDQRGTPNHAMENVARSSKTDVIVRSLGRELLAVRKTVEGLSSWRDGVEQNFASLNQKMDLLLNAMLPSRRSPATVTTEGEEVTERNSKDQLDGGDQSTPKNRDSSTMPDAIVPERTGAASGVTTETCTRNQTIAVPGKR